MAKMILIEEFHVTVQVPPGLPEPTYRKAHRALNSKRLHVRMRRAVERVFRQYLSLKCVRFTIAC